MKKTINKRFFTIMTTAMLVFAMTVSFSFATPSGNISSKINSNKAKSEQLSQSMNDAQAQIESIKGEISNLNEEIGPLQQKVADNQTKLDKKEEELKEEEENLEKRLRNMYKNGTVGFIDVILSSSDITDLITNVELVTKIYSGDKDVVDVLDKQYKEVADIQKDLKSQEDQLNAKIEQLNTTQERLYDTYSQAKADKATVDAETRSLSAQLAQTQQIQTRSSSAQLSQTQQVQTRRSSGGNSSATATRTSYGGGSSSSGGTKTYNAPTSKNGAAVVQFACQFIGNPYVWGGTSLTNGCDCSGFTMAVYAHFGRSLPHNDAAQAAACQRVSNPQPGDLVRYPGHVGIYIGGGQLVHASNPSSGIKISPVNYRSGAAYYRVI